MLTPPLVSVREGAFAFPATEFVGSWHSFFVCVIRRKEGWVDAGACHCEAVQGRKRVLVQHVLVWSTHGLKWRAFVCCSLFEKRKEEQKKGFCSRVRKNTASECRLLHSTGSDKTGTSKDLTRELTGRGSASTSQGIRRWQRNRRSRTCKRSSKHSSATGEQL